MISMLVLLMLVLSGLFYQPTASTAGPWFTARDMSTIVGRTGHKKRS